MSNHDSTMTPPCEPAPSTRTAAKLPEGYTFTELNPSRLRDIWDVDQWAFPGTQHIEDLMQIPWAPPWERMLGVTPPNARNDELAGMSGSFTLDQFPVPGGTLACGGLTWVGVHPGHRRRGLLNAMIDWHFTDGIKRGEPLQALFAAEEAIYQRFGYGRGSDSVSITPGRGAELRDVPGSKDHTVRLMDFDLDTHGELVEGLIRTAGDDIGGAEGINRPGWISRDTPEFRAGHWYDSPTFHRRSGYELIRRLALVEKDGVPRGFATFRRKGDWGDAGPNGTLRINEAVALDAAASHALWTVLLDLDLIANIEATVVPDDPILNLLVDRRAIKPSLGDALWVRILDVPGALSGRVYQADVDVVIGVTDDRVNANEGNWRLRATAMGEVTCERTDAAADFRLDIRTLAGVFMSHTSLAAAAAGGQVEVSNPAALAQAAVAFGWPVPPGTVVDF